VEVSNGQKTKTGGGNGANVNIVRRESCSKTIRKLFRRNYEYLVLAGCTRRVLCLITLWYHSAGPSDRAVYCVGLQSLTFWDCWFESPRGHKYLSIVSVVCSQVEVPGTGRSLVQRSPTECGVMSVISKPPEGKDLGPQGI